MCAYGGCETATSKGQLWIATMGSDQGIYSIGKSEREAIQKARNRIGANRFTPVLFACIPCAPELYNEIAQRGAVGLSWELDESGIAWLSDVHC